jgi:hypothetical protein
MLALTLFPIASISGVEAQTPSFAGTLVYQRNPPTSVEIVSLSAGNKQTYTLPPDKCTAPSPTALYIAQSTSSGADLVISRFDTLQVILQVPWNAQWEPCYIFWMNDTQLAIAQHGATQQFFYFDISNGTLTPFNFQLPPPPQYPALPDWLQNTSSGFILPSPVPNIYLYERCTGHPTGSIDSCPISPNFVIYNVAQQQVIHILKDPSSVQIKGDNQFFYGTAAWSATGRYLAFERLAALNFPFDLAVYDLNTQQYVDKSLGNVEIDSAKTMLWSPRGNKLAFWINGVVGREAEGDPATFRTLVFFDADTRQFIVTDQSNDVHPLVADIGVWSPDGQAFAFIDVNSNLFLIDATTGSETMQDDHVTSIMIWKTSPSACAQSGTATPCPSG